MQNDYTSTNSHYFIYTFPLYTRWENVLFELEGERPNLPCLVGCISPTRAALLLQVMPTSVFLPFAALMSSLVLPCCLGSAADPSTVGAFEQILQANLEILASSKETQVELLWCEVFWKKHRLPSGRGFVWPIDRPLAVCRGYTG